MLVYVAMLYLKKIICEYSNMSDFLVCFQTIFSPQIIL